MMQAASVRAAQAQSRRNHVVVVATAAKESGAWTIVLHLAEEASKDSSTDYTFITVRPLYVPGVENIVVQLASVAERAWFEFYGIRRLLRRTKPVGALLSLNNLPVIGALGIPQYVYVQNSIPFHPEYKWSFKGAERTYFFYRNIYSRVMHWSIKLMRARVIVQTADMAARVADMWRMDALCWFPALSVPSRAPKPTPTSTVDFVYPATWHLHKNHAVLANALAIVKRRRPDIYSKVRVLFTADFPERTGTVGDERIVLAGTVSREQLFAMYASAAAVVFPSLMETVGLPLVEASAMGIPILCADCAYGREILGDYEGAEFVPSLDAERWAEAMIGVADRVCSKNNLTRHKDHKVGLRRTNLRDIAVLGVRDVQR